MTNCCDDYGVCRRGVNCPARSRSEYVANRLMTNITPPNYTPKIMPVKQSFLRELCAYFADGWRHVVLGMALGALMLLVILISFQPLVN